MAGGTLHYPTFLTNRFERISSPRADICVLVFHGLGKRWHGISGEWARSLEPAAR
jgi:hypothetical protein